MDELMVRQLVLEHCSSTSAAILKGEYGEEEMHIALRSWTNIVKQALDKGVDLHIPASLSKAGVEVELDIQAYREAVHEN